MRIISTVLVATISLAILGALAAAEQEKGAKGTVFLGSMAAFAYAENSKPQEEAASPSQSKTSGSDQAAMGVFWRSDFEDGTLGIPNVWFAKNVGGHADCLQVVKTGPIAHGSYALDIHVHPDDCPCKSDKEQLKSRDELGQGGTAKSIARTHSGPGQTTFYRMAYYFPADLNPNEHGYNIITQFHDCSGKGKPPCLAISINAKSKPLKLEIAAKTGESKHPEPWEIGNVPDAPTWVEIILGVHWATDKSGWVEVWRREGLSGTWDNVRPRTSTATLYSGEAIPGAYMKMGYYRGPDGKVGQATGPWPRVSHLIIDNVMAGDSLEAVRNEEPK
jgi:hypothetical protein